MILFTLFLVADPIKVQIGSSHFDTQRLVEHQATYVLSMETANGLQDIQEITRVVTIKNNLITFSWKTEVQGQNVVDQLVMNRPTLAPIQMKSPSMCDGKLCEMHIRFEGNMMHQETLSAGEVISNDEVKQEKPAFCGPVDVPILLSLKLQAGQSYTWPVTDIATGKTGWSSAKVEADGGMKIIHFQNALFKGSMEISDTWPFVISKTLESPQGKIFWRIKADQP